VADFWTDHNVSQRLSPRLRLRGHDSQPIDRLGLGQARDDELLLSAAGAARTLIMHNWKDFELLHDAWRRRSAAWGVDRVHAGIVAVPQTLPEETLSELIADFVTSRASLANELFRWKPLSGWRSR
jgi:hypothetical protein